MAATPIPVEEAKRIAEECNKSIVIVVGWDPVHSSTWVTTFGTTAQAKEIAVAGAEKIKEALNLGDLEKTFQDFRKDMNPAFLKEAVDLLQAVKKRNTDTVTNQKIDFFLKRLKTGK